MYFNIFLQKKNADNGVGKAPSGLFNYYMTYLQHNMLPCLVSAIQGEIHVYLYGIDI